MISVFFLFLKNIFIVHVSPSVHQKNEAVPCGGDVTKGGVCL